MVVAFWSNSTVITKSFVESGAKLLKFISCALKVIGGSCKVSVKLYAIFNVEFLAI
jgi:hypothetical protein